MSPLSGYLAPRVSRIGLSGKPSVQAAPRDRYEAHPSTEDVSLALAAGLSRAARVRAARKQAPKGVYFDQATDASRQFSYYLGLQLDANPRAAFLQLSKLVTRSHTTRLPYQPEKYLYPVVDVRPNGGLQSIYSPNSVVEMTPARQRALDRSLMSMACLSGMCPIGAGAAMALTQSFGNLNCEHVVPQSWYDHAEPMRGDLHHLFACESRCNSFRGARPYKGTTQDTLETVTSCGQYQAEGKGFQPEGGRGAVARATFYFLVRYPKKAKAYSAEDLQTLLAWHRAEPVSLYEKHRNAAIQDLQGNRNPFIDHPEWVDQIDLTQGLRKHPVEVV